MVCFEAKMSDLHLVVGLGNPGRKYQDTRHNIGWAVLDELARRHALGTGRSERRALIWDGRILHLRVKLAKPQTFMNRSGESVRALMDYYDIALDRLLVVHDDLDTPLGKLKLRKAGGHGGQNGLRSIIQHLGSQDFARLRVGIGRPPGRMDPVDYVLQPFRGRERELANELAGRSADAIEAWLRDGIESAMSSFNGEAGSADGPRSPANLEEKYTIVQRAHELAPRDPKALARLISIQKKLGLLDDAVANHLKLARLYHQVGEDSLAISEKVKAVTIQPERIELQREIADWYLQQDNRKKAVSRYLILAEYFRAQGAIASAKAAVERALSINPQHPKAQTLMCQLLELEARA
jgi:PTH1 family peptidyl-tRNA hydrolase